LAGALAMNPFARAAQAMNEGHEAAGAAPGRHRDGRGVQPPQAEFNAEDDPVVRTGKIVYRALTAIKPAATSRRGLAPGRTMRLAPLSASVTVSRRAVSRPYGPVWVRCMAR
jgi:hypothetical protein